MGAPWRSLPAYRGEEFGVEGSDRFVVVNDGDPVGDIVHELLTARPVGFIGEMNADQKLGDGDGRDGYFVIVGDEVL